MKNRILLRTILLSGIGLTTALSVQAQTPKRANVIGNIAQARFVVNEPSSVSGTKTFTLATWGADGSTPYIKYEVEKAYDTLAAATLTNSPSFHPLTGKFALIFRGGGVNFSDKVARAQAAGAAGVIIVNNVAGDLISMGATPSTFTTGLPVLMISDVDGMAINNLVKAGTIVKVSLSKWAMGATHDLGLIANYQATPHALNIPISQMAGSAGTKEYLQYVGGAVANYGTSTETGITVTDSVFWTPTSGTTSFVTSHAYTIASIAPSDSVAFGFGSATYSLTPPTTTGRYDHKYSIAYGNVDETPGDNVGSLSAYVTDSIFCRGRYDFTNKRPRTTIGYAPVDGTSGSITGPYMWGSLMYVKNGGYAAKTIQASLSVAGGGSLSGLSQPWAYLYKWTDTVGGAPDSLVSVSELTGVALGTITFTSADSSGQTLNFKMRDFDNPTSGKTVVLEDNTWYWVVIEAPLNSYLGCEEGISPFTRIYSQYVLAGGGDAKLAYDRDEVFGLLDKSTLEDLKGTNPTALLANYPFSGNSFFVDSMFYDRYKSVPSIALITSTGITAIKDVKTTSIGEINVYPNPTTNGTATVEVSLDKKFDKVQYKVIDAIGRTVFYEAHQNVQKETFTLNTSSYAPGNYYLLIVTDAGIANKKITVQK